MLFIATMNNRSTGLNNSRDSRMNSSSPASRTPGGRRLSTPLATEVRSPGFASRLTSYIRDSRQLDPPRRDASAPPGGTRNRYPVVQPKYSGIGLFPKVILNRPPLPRLTPTRRRSCGLSNVTVKVAQVNYGDFGIGIRALSYKSLRFNCSKVSYGSP